jgi:hypothetical protein
LWFKGQRDLSLRNDFNRQWLETARIATLSQQIASRGPNKNFPVIAFTPHHASSGAGWHAERSRGLKLDYRTEMYHMQGWRKKQAAAGLRTSPSRARDVRMQYRKMSLVRD